MGIGPNYRHRSAEERERDAYDQAQSTAKYLDEKHQKELDDLYQANPDPNRWELVEEVQCGKFLAIKIRYPNCTNHKGLKVMVFKCTLSDLVKQKQIDPHFGEGGLIYPIARFPPDEDGWANALNFASGK